MGGAAAVGDDDGPGRRSLLRAPLPARQKKKTGQGRSFSCCSEKRAYAAFLPLLSKNCSSSVEPFSAAVEASLSTVVVTASK